MSAFRCPTCDQTVPDLPRCACGHLDTSHDIHARTKARTSCSVSSGPKGVRCSCTGYTELPAPAGRGAYPGTEAPPVRSGGPARERATGGTSATPPTAPTGGAA